MKILKSFTNLFTKTGKDDRMTKTDSYLSEDFYKRVREREAAEKKRREKWKTKIGKMSNNNNTAYGSGIGHLPSNIASGTISTTTRLGDSKVTIDGGENGSMRVDVPLLVNGRDVMKELDEMRDALLLLKRDVDMESKYPKLKEIKDEYEAALAKYTTFDTLKESK